MGKVSPEIPPLAGMSQEGALPELGLLSVVVIDPHPAAAEGLARLVAARGMEAGLLPMAGALDLFQASSLPDVLLLRLNRSTAGMVAEFLRQREVHPSGDEVYVIAVTDEPEPVSRVEAWLRRGVDDFVSDPLRAADAELLGPRLAVAEHAQRLRRRRSRAGEEREAAGRLFWTIFENSPVGTLLAAGEEGRILEANTAAASVLDPPPGGLRGHCLAVVLPELFECPEFDPGLLSESGGLRLPEILRSLPDGSPRWLDILVSRPQGLPPETLLLQLRDITSQKDAETVRLREARMEAARRVMSGTARELGDSLTSIRGNLELLQRQPASRLEMRELCLQAGGACDRAVALSKRLTAFSRLAQGGDLQKRPLDLRALLEKTVPFALLGGRARPEIHCAPDLWPAFGDEAALTDLLRRLIANADEAMPDGGTLRLEAGNVDAGGRESGISSPAALWLSLRDEGQGIAAGHMACLFDPWFTTKSGHEGMGLAVVAALVKAQGGQIRVASEPGRGSLFTLWLPAVFPGSSPPGRAEDGSGHFVGTEAEAKTRAVKARVLFMDDDSGIRMVMQRLLTSSGYEVYCTCDGQEAIEAYRKAAEFGSSFDLVLVDLEVRGGMGGQECVARLKAEFPGLKALLTTGCIDDVLMETYPQHGFLGVVPKPFQIDQLLLSLDRLAGVA